MYKNKSIEIILAPSSLGLRPNEHGLEPGTWKAPALFLESGLAERINAKVVKLDHPSYDFDAQFGTKIRNGLSIREFSLRLANVVDNSLKSDSFPVVLGGDCSILLGCLLGTRRWGGKGLVHIDGHCDYFHPGNYDVTSRLGTVAGMDLALATGKGELLLTNWPGIRGALVEEGDAFQIGERNAEHPEFPATYGDIASSSISLITIQQLLTQGLETTAKDICKKITSRGLKNVWLHVDFDILDQIHLPAVDSPGSPGLDFKGLEIMLTELLQSGLFTGIDFTIYDPDLDPEKKYLPQLSHVVEKSLLSVFKN
ncbi:arginase [Chitinophaga polysaccharea]|uniref:Arginase n=1 Tax=Chitinophaga polysaccharea TaxID=1293035 RepID=A0A561P6X3_9BACT|nr:arginase family protein [Chitinophaga polysaccharea]TWF33872.1 arginase [Chitinophaga polysaccharea]